jgi:hypothetical protein
MDAAEAGDFSEFTARDHFTGEAKQRIFDVVVANLGDNTGCFGSLHHVTGLRRGRGKRLFTMNVLSSSDCSQGHLTMKDVGCRD